MWNLLLVHLEIVLVSVQDRCMVCAKHTINSEIILDAPDVGHAKSHLFLFGDSVSVSAK